MSHFVLWYVRIDFPIVSVNNLVRMYRLPSPVMMYGTSGFHWKSGVKKNTMSHDRRIFLLR